MRDHIFDELREDLRRTDPNFPFIEIATESNALEMAGWMSDGMTRVSRDTLSTQLSPILVMELAKVMYPPCDRPAARRKSRALYF